MKIPKDVSGFRKKLAEAAILRKRGTVTKTPQQQSNPANDERVRKAREEAIKSRRELQSRNKAEAEKDLRIQELEQKLAETEKLVTDYEPAAKRWNEYSHKEKERLISKLPKELHREARDMDVKHLRLLVESHGGAIGTTPEAKKPATGIRSLEDAAKASPAEYNAFMDSLSAGKIKVDDKGQVVA